MRSRGHLVLSVLIGHLTVGLEVLVNAERYCWNSTKTGEPRILPGFATIVEAYMGDFVRLKCCASGFDAINWYRQDSGFWSLIDANDLDDTYNIYEDGQILQIQTALPQDNTNFRCDISKNGIVVMNGIVRLVVHACRQSGRGPVLTDPFPSNLTIKEFGGDARFECSASLSCSDDVASVLLRWCINNCNEPVSTRYNISQYTHKDNKYLKTSVLQIHNISPEDLDQRFICQVDSPDIIGGHSAVTIRIFKIPEVLPTWAIVLLSALGTLIVVIVIICVIRALLGPRMRFIINSYCPYFAPKPVSRDEYKYNVGLVHGDSPHDQDTADLLEKMLNTYRLEVNVFGYILGKTQSQIYEQIHAECAVIIVLNSPSLLNRDRLYLDGLIEMRNGNRIIAIDIGTGNTATYPSPDALNHSEHLGQCLNMQESVPEVDGEGTSINNETPVGDGDELRDIPDKCHDQTTTHKLFTGLNSIKLPTRKSSNRQKKNFECQLVNKIPKFLTDEHE